MKEIPILYVKERWFRIIIAGEKRFEFRLGKRFFTNLLHKYVWLSTHDTKKLIFINSIRRYKSFESIIEESPHLISYIDKSEFLFFNKKIYSDKDIKKYGVLALEIIDN